MDKSKGLMASIALQCCALLLADYMLGPGWVRVLLWILAPSWTLAWWMERRTRG